MPLRFNTASAGAIYAYRQTNRGFCGLTGARSAYAISLDTMSIHVAET
jgi:hypothetical protein